MPDDRFDPPPVVNPVLALKKEPKPEAATGRSKNAKQIVTERLPVQRKALSDAIDAIAKTPPSAFVRAGRVPLVTRMFSDSSAPTWTPSALFHASLGMSLIAPTFDGYLVEATVSRLDDLSRAIRTTARIDAMVDISRVEAINAFTPERPLRGRSVADLWEAAIDVEGGRAFILTMLPFRDHTARVAVVQNLVSLGEKHAIIAKRLVAGETAPSAGVPAVPFQGTSLGAAIRHYRGRGFGRGVVTVASIEALTELASSGVSYRIDPVRPIEIAEPGEGAHPDRPIPAPASQPVVAIIDGGMTAASYKPLEVFRTNPPLVPDAFADTDHGNKMTSVIVQGHAWNNNLPLPQLDCRFATVQVVPNKKAPRNYHPEPDQIIAHLRQFARDCPAAKVWNLSFTAQAPEPTTETVSYLGDQLARLAREVSILPITAIGNTSPLNPSQWCAPADCEASITVSGRTYDAASKGPGGPCPVSLRGPGPAGMRKPDLSWYSPLRVIGGVVASGSSFPTGLYANLSAHTLANLRDPDPDLARALLINATEGGDHCHALGWGTPQATHLPWTCPPGTVIMAWRATLQPGFNYYWNDIPIPPQLVHNGKLRCRASLTAVHAPLLSELGDGNYFASRVQVALQYPKKGGGWGNLAGTMREDKAAEEEARTDLNKWGPIRRHYRERRGLQFDGASLRMYGRVFARDIFQFNVSHHSELPPLSAAFVLTLSDGSESPDIYNATIQSLQAYVESAVLGVDIETTIGG